MAGQEGMSHTAPGVNFRQRSDHWPVVLSVYQRGSLLDGLAMYFSCDTKKFHDNVSTHILHSFWTSTHRGEASPLWGATADYGSVCRQAYSQYLTAAHNSMHPLSTSSVIARHFLDFMVQGKITEADALRICLDVTPPGLLMPPPSSSPPLLHWMPFLPQPSQFILARDRHWIMLAFIAGGLVWNDIHQEISRDKNQQIKQHQTTDDTCLQIISRIEADLNWKYTQRSMQFYHSSYNI